MGIISLVIPQIGQPDTTEDVKIQNAFTTIQTVINGNLDTNNISPTAGIKFTQLSPGAWTALTLGSGVGVASGSDTPSARLEGDVVRLKSALINNSGASIVAGTTLVTIPALLAPTTQRRMGPALNSGSITDGLLLVTTGGILKSSWGWANATILPLDGLSYTLT